MSETAERDPELMTMREVFVGILRMSEKSGYRIIKDDPTFPVLKVGGSGAFDGSP